MRARLAAVALLALLLAGCSPQQSALHPAGEEAAGVATLFWVMSGAGALIWIAVMGTAVFAVLSKRRPRTEKFADWFILISGLAVPSVLLAVLLVFGLSLLPAWTEDEAPGLRVRITAEQYWWRMEYERPDGRLVETANQLHLPVDTVAEFVIDSPDVIHSFWIPALGGKIDAIPGRTNHLRLHPTKTGTYRGVCAEFCGPSHALMAFPVVVHDAAGFAAWLEAEAAPASGDAGAFIAAGCGACHSVRGVSEGGRVAPDLTHIGSRQTIAAGTLPNSAENMMAWITDPEAIKPGARMPGFAMLPEAERQAIVTYLMELR